MSAGRAAQAAATVTLAILSTLVLYVALCAFTVAQAAVWGDWDWQAMTEVFLPWIGV